MKSPDSRAISTADHKVPGLNHARCIVQLMTVRHFRAILTFSLLNLDDILQTIQKKFILSFPGNRA